MAKLHCPCGHIFSNVSETEWRSFASFLVSPGEMDELRDGVRSTDDEKDDVEYREIWKCPKCGRLAVDDAVGSMEVKFYVPEARAELLKPHQRAALGELGRIHGRRSREARESGASRPIDLRATGCDCDYCHAFDVASKGDIQ